TRSKVSTDDDSADARQTVRRQAVVYGSAVEREQAAFAVAHHADRRMVLLAREPVHGGEDLLHLVADDVAAHLVGHAVNELAARLIRLLLQRRVARVRVLAINKRRHEDATALLREAAGILRLLRHPRR